MKKQVMSLAWSLYRKAGYQGRKDFGRALKAAWAIVKGEFKDNVSVSKAYGGDGYFVSTVGTAVVEMAFCKTFDSVSDANEYAETVANTLGVVAYTMKEKKSRAHRRAA